MAMLRIDGKTVSRDVLAGLTAAIAAIPDGMASAVLAGVNPIFGLYNLMFGTPVAALFTSSVNMAVINTSAMALVVFETLKGYSGEEQIKALVTLTLLVGAFMLLSGLLKLGWLTRFISNAVMQGFLTGIAIVIVLSQLSDFTGYASEGANKVAQTVDLTRNLGQIDLPTLAVGVLTIVLILILDRTRLSSFSMLIALVVAALLVNWIPLESADLVGDIPGGLPKPMLPELSLVPELLLAAVAIGIIGLVQAAGVSQGFPNPDGKYPDPDGDFRGQGLGNIAAGFFQGLPLGGSVSGTTLVVGAGAKSRWANIFTGLFVAIGVLLFATMIGKLPMASLAGILILAGFQAIKPTAIRRVWDANHQSAVVFVLTLVATLFLPVQQAIFLGVLIHILIIIFQSAERMTIKELVPTPDGDFVIQPAPKELPSHQVTMLLPDGSLYFAAARDFEEEAPLAEDAKRAVVVLILRGRPQLGSTAMGVFERYARALQKNAGTLYLVAVSEGVRAQLEKTGMLDLIGEDNVLPESDLLLSSLRQAYDVAQAWLEKAPSTSKE